MAAKKESLHAAAPRRIAPLLISTPPAYRARIQLTAQAAILVDASTGRVLWEKRPHAHELIASTTKIMTAVVALERLRPYDLVTVDPYAARAAPYREGLRPRERVQAWKLFYGLLLYSGNDDAVALAIAAAGSRAAFLDRMNEEARLLGMRDTHFTTPSGVIDDGNYSSAWDMAVLARYALEQPRFAAIVRTRVKRVPWSPPIEEKVYVNKNRLLKRYPGADGVKTGWTTLARHSIVASARRHGIRLIAVALRSDDLYGDATRLLDFGFSRMDRSLGY